MSSSGSPLTRRELREREAARLAEQERAASAAAAPEAGQATPPRGVGRAAGGSQAPARPATST
ncbi:hypothetical protein, partial [Cellulomonas sp. PS-H5]|uniref:hypothetical protein n=1 Tax=Cellulomonas sp. PS-H5 TaxID=2820400 RepID=UPI001C4ED39C